MYVCIAKNSSNVTFKFQGIFRKLHRKMPKFHRSDEQCRTIVCAAWDTKTSSVFSTQFLNLSEPLMSIKVEIKSKCTVKVMPSCVPQCRTTVHIFKCEYLSENLKKIVVKVVG